MTFDLVLGDARVVTPSGVIDRGWVGIDGGKITALESGPVSRSGASATETVSLAGDWLGPGFIDVHVHGSVDIDVMSADRTQMERLSRYLATRGVTSYLFGTYTANVEDTHAALQVLADTGEHVAGGANILGAYMEGPFLNPLRKGAHRPDLLRAVDVDEARSYLDTGVVRMMVLAPELGDGDELIGTIQDAGAVPVAGHTDATYAQLAHAVDQGVRSVTHVFNGMRGLHHRELGAAGAALVLDDVVCEVIADGVHLTPELMTLLWRAKGPQGIALITDAGPAGGRPDGTYRAIDGEVEVSGGVGRLPDGTICSSASTMDRNVALFRQATALSIPEVWPSASEVPARVVGVLDRKGTVEVGKDADVVGIDNTGAVTLSVVGGRIVDLTDGAWQ